MTWWCGILWYTTDVSFSRLAHQLLKRHYGVSTGCHWSWDQTSSCCCSEEWFSYGEIVPYAIAVCPASWESPVATETWLTLDMLWFLDFEWFWMMFTCNFPDISKTIHHLRMHFWSAVAQITLRPMPSHSGARKPRRSAKDLRLTAEPLMKFEESTGEKNVWFGLIFSEILRFAEHDPRHLRPCSKMCLGLPLSQLCSTRRHDGCYNSWILLHWPVIKDAFCSEAWKPDLLSGEELGKILVAGYRERQRFNRWRCDEGYVGITDRQLFTAWVLDCNLSSKAVQFFQWN